MRSVYYIWPLSVIRWGRLAWPKFLSVCLLLFLLISHYAVKLFRFSFLIKYECLLSKSHVLASSSVTDKWHFAASDQWCFLDEVWVVLCTGENDAAGLETHPEDQLFPFQIGSVHSDPVAKQPFRADLFQLLPQLVH